MYKYKDYSDAEDGKEEFVASPSDDNNNKDLSDAKFVEKVNPKSQRIRVGKARGRGSATPTISVKRTPVRFINKHQSHLFC